MDGAPHHPVSEISSTIVRNRFIGRFRSMERLMKRSAFELANRPARVPRSSPAREGGGSTLAGCGLLGSARAEVPFDSRSKSVPFCLKRVSKIHKSDASGADKPFLFQWVIWAGDLHTA